MSRETWRLPTPSGYPVPVTWYPASGEARASLILMAALGVPAGFYDKFAAALAERDLNVALMEQRGHGDSELRPSRRCDWGFADIIDEDLPATLERVHDRAPRPPLMLLGHSLGGHYAAIYAGLHPAQVEGVIMVATGSPWWKVFQGRTRKLVRYLIRLIPVVNMIFGYYPGERIGFGGREARTIMTDWRDLARTNQYSARGLSHDLDTGIAAYRGPVLAIRFADDPFAPSPAVKAVTGKFRVANLTETVLTAEDLGDKADHFRWTRQATVVADRIAGWLKDRHH